MTYSISTALCKSFGISDQVIERRVEREAMWPPKIKYINGGGVKLWDGSPCMLWLKELFVSHDDSMMTLFELLSSVPAGITQQATDKNANKVSTNISYISQRREPSRNFKNYNTVSNIS